MREDAERALSLDVHNFNYFRNYEYFNDIADGLTYYGLQLSPVLTWQANEHLLLYGGVFLRQDFGNEGFRKIQPLIGIKYQKNGLSLVNGALEAHAAHRYVEPLFDYDRIITDPVEYGTQLILDRPRHHTDVWVNWENMIYKNSDEQEKIMGGISSRIRLWEEGLHRLSLPLQALLYHSGGQIDTGSLPVRTWQNYAVGLAYRWEKEGALKALHTENYFLLYRLQGEDPDNPYSSGMGAYLNAGADTRWLNLMLSYWAGNDFVAPLGAPLFQSLSSKTGREGFTQDKRNLLFLRLIKDFTLADELQVSARFEPALDLDSSQLDYSMSLYLVYRGIFELINN